MKHKSIKNIRQEFKDNGIFYTPIALAERLKSYVDIEPTSVYDPTCGAGSLLSVFSKNVKKYGQELDAEQLNLIDLPNFEGYPGDTLTDDKFKGVHFDCIVANPPFSTKWDPDALTEDIRFRDCPSLPPPSKADWAFMLHILHHLSDNGVAAVLEFPGILYRGQRERKVRQWFVEKNYIDRVVNIPGNIFEDTPIATCIVVLKKNRATTDIIFEDRERIETVPFSTVEKNGFNLSPNTYITREAQKEDVNIAELLTEGREKTIRILESELELEKFLCELSNLDIQSFLNDLKQLIVRYEK